MAIYTYRRLLPATDPKGDPLYWGWDGWGPVEKALVLSEEERCCLGTLQGDIYEFGPMVPMQIGEWEKHLQQVFPVKARYELRGQEYQETLVINPGGWNGEAWVVVMASGEHYVVEAEESEVMNTLYDECEEAAAEMRISEENVADYQQSLFAGEAAEMGRTWAWREDVEFIGNHGDPCDTEGIQYFEVEDLVYVGKPTDLY